MGTKKRRRFSREFKLEAVRLGYSSGRRLSDVARELDVRPDQIRRWRDAVEAGSSPAVSESDAEVRRLRRRLAETEEERDISKRALAIVSVRRR